MSKYSNEGLEKFIEAVSIDNRLIKKASEVELRESISTAKNGGRLTESVIKLTEDSDCTTGWWVPISKYDNENANGRKYGKQLWLNVYNNQRDIWCGAPMLADHPADDSDGSPKDICGVWLDMRIDPVQNGVGLVYGLLVPSGRLGEDLKDHLHKGLRVGTSSSGFGKLMADNVTVDPDTYYIERLSDWVLNPSQGTFFEFEEDEESSEGICESIEAKKSDSDVVLNEDKKVTEVIVNDRLKENVVTDQKIAKLEEKKFRRDMVAFLEDAENIRDPQERLNEFREIEGFLANGACPDLKEKIQEKIAAEEALIKEAINNSIEMKEKLNVESAKDLEAKLTKIVEEAALVDKEAKDWKSVAEKLQDKLTLVEKELKGRPSQKYVEFQKNKIDNLKNEKVELNKKAADVVRKVNDSNKALREANEGLKAKIASLEGALNECKSQAAESQKAFNESVSTKDALMMKVMDEDKELKAQNEELKESIKKMEEEFKSLKEKFVKVFTEKDKANSKMAIENSNLVKENKKYASSMNSLKERVLNVAAKVSAQKSDLEEVKKTNENLEKNLAVTHRHLENITEKANQFADAREAELEFNRRVAIRNGIAPVEEYYESLENRYGKEVMREFKSDIMKCPTLASAKNLFFSKIVNELPESREVEKMRIPESLMMTPEKRAAKIGLSSDKQEKYSVINNLTSKHEGWV